MERWYAPKVCCIDNQESRVSSVKILPVAHLRDRDSQHLIIDLVSVPIIGAR